MTGNALDTLRGIFADCQDVLSAPDVDRGMCALARVAAAIEAARDISAYANEKGPYVLVRLDEIHDVAAALRALDEGEAR